MRIKARDDVPDFMQRNGLIVRGDLWRIGVLGSVADRLGFLRSPEGKLACLSSA